MKFKIKKNTVPFKELKAWQKWMVGLYFGLIGFAFLIFISLIPAVFQMYNFIDEVQVLIDAENSYEASIANETDPERQNSIAWRYFYKKGGIGKSYNYRKAAQWWHRSANQGFAKAQYNLGYAYSNGYGVKKNPEKAVYWQKKAADQGLVQAENSLGHAYRQGRGIKKSYDLAYIYLTRAYNKGNSRAAFGLGILYEHGLGQSQSIDAARVLYAKALEGGFDYATQHYNRLDGV